MEWINDISWMPIGIISITTGIIFVIIRTAFAAGQWKKDVDRDRKALSKFTNTIEAKIDGLQKDVTEVRADIKQLFTVSPPSRGQ